MAKPKKRLTKIYTRSGDKGSTGLGDGSRVAKTHERIEAIGAVDELNSWMGLVINEVKGLQSDEPLTDRLQKIQHELFNVGGELAMPGFSLVLAPQVDDLELWLDELNANLPPLTNFILPGGSKLACYCHMARTVARRAERRVWSASEAGESINEPLLKYLNRLSDLLFVLARVVARETGGEVLWEQPSSPAKP